MYYNVAQLLKEPVGSTRTYRITEPIPIGGGDTHTLSRGQLSFMRTDKGIWMSAKVEVHAWITCSRCLKRLPYPLSFAMEEEYLPTVEVNTGQSLRVPERAEGYFTIDYQHGLDLREALRQYAITNQPMKPLCCQDCLGLCLICGADLNENSCFCQERDVDPRWSPLVNLLEGSCR